MKDKEKAVEREWIGNERARKLFAYLDWDKDPVQRKTKAGDAQRNAEKIYHYIANEEAPSVPHVDMGNAGVAKERDAKNGGRSLNDFVNLPEAQKAKLKPVHVLALRLYTSTSFSLITMPLRKEFNHLGEELWDVGLVLPNGWKDTCGDDGWDLDTRYQHTDGSKQREHPGKEVDDGIKRHPFAATVYFLAEALNQLRFVGLCEEGTTKADLFSWVSSKTATVRLIDASNSRWDYKKKVPPTSNRQLVSEEGAPIIKMMDWRGFDISFLSLYASEECSYLYPPLIYLRPRAAVIRGGKTEILVEAVFPS
jgi:hypothetical protein